MAYCPNCGVSVENFAPPQPQEPVEVTLARLDKERAIEVARIEAGARRAEAASAEVIAEVEGDARVEAAAAIAEVVTATEEETAPEPLPEPEAVIVEAPAVEEEPSDAPPVVEPSEPSEPRRRGLGMW